MAPVGRLRAERKQRGTKRKNEATSSQKTHRTTKAETALKNIKKWVNIEPKMAPKSLLPASWQLLALTWRFSALSWRLWAASWRSWGLLGASWGALVAMLAPRENLAIMEREARSFGELQALQAANNKDAKHQQSILVKLRGRAPRPRSASWRGVAWNASRAGGRNRSLETKEKS